MTIRIDLFKHTSTVSSALAAICVTFLLTRLDEPSPSLILLGVSVLCFVIVTIFSVLAMSNQAYHVNHGQYGLLSEGRFSLLFLYLMLLLGVVLAVAFTGLNMSLLTSKKSQKVTDEVKTYVKDYVDTTTKTLFQRDVSDALAKELQNFSLQIDKEIHSLIAEHDKTVRQYVQNNLINLERHKDKKSHEVKVERFIDLRGINLTVERLAEFLFPKDHSVTSVALNIFFELNSSKILPRHYSDLDKLGKALTLPQYADYFIQIEGHTDNSGSEHYNQNLSERRAENVKQYLVKRFPIEPQRLAVKGYGEIKPRAINATPDGQAMNRRVEIVNLGQER